MIIVTEIDDVSTNKVIEWLIFYNSKFERVNINFDFSSFNIQIGNDDDSRSKITSKNNLVWNRRGHLSFITSELFSTPFINHSKNDEKVSLLAIEYLQKNKFIGSYERELNNNKIINLEVALNVGLKIPETIITNNKYDLLEFLKPEKEYISKPLNYPLNVEINDDIYYGKGTTKLNLDLINETFSPSLIQEYIEKEIEIRVYYIKDVFFPMAIFSQNDDKTKIDYRCYNHEKPNRNVPFILPNKILKKLKRFISSIKCNSGSIDLILTPNNEYIFLELNPMGQYDWVSQYCNYYIDKRIAELLIEEELNYENKY